MDKARQSLGSDFGFLQQRRVFGNPEGGRHGWRPFSDRGRKPSPKIPGTSAWLERFRRHGKGAFFGYFLCTSKESNSPKGESSSLWGGCFRRPKMDKDQVRFALTGEVLSVGYFSLHQQRKVTRREAKALRGKAHARSPRKGKIKFVSPSRASYFLLLAQKKVTKENGLLVRSSSLRGLVVPSPFSDRPSMAWSENGRHPCRPPSGCPIRLGS